MDRISQFVETIFVNFPKTNEMEELFDKVVFDLENKVLKLVGAGVDENKAIDKVVSDFNSSKNGRSKLERKYLAYSELSKSSSDGISELDVKLLDKKMAEDFIKIRQRISFMIYMASILLSTGVLFLGVYGFLKDGFSIITKLQISNLTFGLILFTIMLITSVSLYIYSWLELNKTNKLVEYQKFNLSKEASDYLTERQQVFNRYYYKAMLIIGFILNSSILFVSINKALYIFVGITILILSGTLLIYLGGYNKSLNLLLKKYNYADNFDLVYENLKRVTMAILPSMFIFTFAVLFLKSSISLSYITIPLSLIIFGVFRKYYEVSRQNIKFSNRKDF